MLCPVDGETLVMADRGGVEIDYCPKCRGVWLDRGELDKIIDRAAGPAPVAAQAPAPRPAPGAGPVYQQEPGYGQRQEPPRRRDDDDDDYRYDGKRRKKSLLGELFDF